MHILHITPAMYIIVLYQPADALSGIRFYYVPLYLHARVVSTVPTTYTYLWVYNIYVSGMRQVMRGERRRFMSNPSTQIKNH